MNRRSFLMSVAALSAGAFLGGFDQPAFAAEKKVLVAYFSATGRTKNVAKTIATAVNGDLYEITPEKTYTDADLDWHNKQSRSSLEMADSHARPKIAGALPDMSKYDVVFLGYPIWWGIAPRILQTFVESAPLQRKIVVPFCTSGGSPFANSDDLLRKAVPSAQWKSGRCLKTSVSAAEMTSWAKKLGVR